MTTFMLITEDILVLFAIMLLLRSRQSLPRIIAIALFALTVVVNYLVISTGTTNRLLIAIPLLSIFALAIFGRYLFSASQLVPIQMSPNFLKGLVILSATILSSSILVLGLVLFGHAR